MRDKPRRRGPATSPSHDLAAVPVTPALRVAIRQWLGWLANERRASPHTLDAYSRGLAAFVGFLAEHLGRPPGLGSLEALRKADFRAWLARRVENGLAPSSTARALSVVRSFFRYCARNDLPRVAAILVMREAIEKLAYPEIGEAT